MDSRPRTEVWLATPQAASRLDLARLDPTERVTWNRLHTARRRLDWASTQALRQALAGDTRQNWSESLSHSRGHAALVRTTGNASMGVDLEWLAPREFLSIARMAFTPEEARELESLGEQAQVCAGFYEYWTLKEALAKALKLPLADALSKCCFAGTGSAAAAWLPIGLHWRAIVYAPRPLIRLAVVFVDDSTGSAVSAPVTMEWPPKRETAWPVVKTLEGFGSGNQAVLASRAQSP